MSPDEPVQPIPMPEGEPPNEDVQTEEDGDDTLYRTPMPSDGSEERT